ncbi:hypothetical protein BD779DRAFT_1485255 [Infundibulicybe gibba]|nr:hypothetical protein BD779DRAFT_1485255 [Infundibulicybe gibba]
MGLLCSKSNSHSGGHTVLSSSADTPGRNQAAAPSDPRAAAAAAAEQRLKASQARGTHASNPKKGQLAAQVANHSKQTAEPRQDDRLVWD